MKTMATTISAFDVFWWFKWRRSLCCTNYTSAHMMSNNDDVVDRHQFFFIIVRERLRQMIEMYAHVGEAIFLYTMDVCCLPSKNKLRRCYPIHCFLRLISRRDFQIGNSHHANVVVVCWTHLCDTIRDLELDSPPSACVRHDWVGCPSTDRRDSLCGFASRRDRMRNFWSSTTPKWWKMKRKKNY